MVASCDGASQIGPWKKALDETSIKASNVVSLMACNFVQEVVIPQWRARYGMILASGPPGDPMRV